MSERKGRFSAIRWLRKVAIPLHLMTGVGGFWLSRIWQNASVFAGLWLILAALQRLLDAVGSEWMGRDASLLEIPSSYFHLKAIYVLAVIGLAGVSVICFAKGKILSASSRLSNPVVSVVLGLLAIAVTYAEVRDAGREIGIYLRQGGIEISRASPYRAQPSIHRDVRFADSAMWGRFVFLPYGRDGAIKGRVILEGKPVQSRVKAYLNEYYRTPVALSDPDGHFVLPAPRGEWEINRISVSLDTVPPIEDDLVLTVLDGKRKAPPFDSDFFGEVHYQGRLRVKAAVNPERDEFTLQLRRHIDVTWPVRGKKMQPANRETSVIKWQPAEGAAEYRLQVFELTREADGMASAIPILQRTVDRPELPLKTLRTATSPAKKLEYYVEVRAFSKDDELLTLSKSAFDDSTFILEGALSLVREINDSANCAR